MKAIIPIMRLRRMDFLDYIMFALFFIIIGLMIGSYNVSLSNFTSQNWVISWFIAIAIVTRPVVRFFK